MSISVTDICDNTKLAREMSLLGNYETASVYYQGVVQQIHRLLGTFLYNKTRMGTSISSKAIKTCLSRADFFKSTQTMSPKNRVKIKCKGNLLKEKEVFIELFILSNLAGKKAKLKFRR